MNLKSIGEFGFIERISGGCLIHPKRVVRAIGDDAAAFHAADGQLTLVTTDLLVERVHFLRDTISPWDLGHKSLAVNLSDIAAMGGTADHAFVSLAIPPDIELATLDGIYDGMKELAGNHRVNLLGGDTTSSKADLVINIAVVGSVNEAEMLCRHTARADDVVVSTGELGDSKAGLTLILEPVELEKETRAALIGAHVKPRPHLEEGRFLATFGGVRAAIDVSDGLSSDLGHIARESRLGFRLDAARIPLSQSLREFADLTGHDALRIAVDGGEDYCLIACVAPDRLDALRHAYEDRFRRPIHVLGQMTQEPGGKLVWQDGRTETVEAAGWNHFRS